MTQQLLQRGTPSRTLTAVPRSRTWDGWFALFVRNLAPQDWYIASYFAVMMLAVVLGTGPDREHCVRLVCVDIACLFGGLALTRGEILRAGSYLNGMAYRLTVWLAVFLSYFQLRHILPAVSERAVDADLLKFDLRVFHVEPSLAWDKFVTPVTTEWFAFFYFGYFFLLSAHVLGLMLAARNKFHLAHFAMGIFLLFCTGHIIYMIVPGYGPYWYLGAQFQHELTGGTFWHLVQQTVQAGGAQKDIFPSLHTAAPTYFAMFSFRHRKSAPYKYSWIFVAFCATQIICATMFLRWHYLVDIFAGITLATFACTVGEILVVRDIKRRARLTAELGEGAVQANFELLDYSWIKRLFVTGERSPTSSS